MTAARNAGLKNQARQAEAELALRRMGLKPLSTEELNMLQRWFPTSYRESYHYCNCGQAVAIPAAWFPLSGYAFDRVPTSVLELLPRLRDELKLDWVEIPTPEENRRQDPGLFGGKGPLTVLAARWGESDDRLVTFEEIKRGLWARNRRSGTIPSLILAVVISLLSVFLCTMAATNPGPVVIDPVLFKFGTTISLAVGAAAVSVVGFWRRRLRRAFAYAFA